MIVVSPAELLLYVGDLTARICHSANPLFHVSVILKRSHWHHPQHQHQPIRQSPHDGFVSWTSEKEAKVLLAQANRVSNSPKAPRRLETSLPQVQIRVCTVSW